MEKHTAVCDKCGKKFDSGEEALTHEKNHQKEKAFDNIKIFELKQIHVDLLKETSIGWQDCEFGAPEIDPKRPYGNSSVEDDIAEYMKLKKNGHWDFDNETWDDKTLELINDTHKETQIALQIVLHTQTFELGKYKLLEDGWQKWVKLK